MGLQTFSHVGVCVSDLERSTRFYTDVLGFTEILTTEMGPEVAATMEIERPRFRSRILGRPDLRVELLEWIDPPVTGATGRRPMNQLGLTHLCFRVEDIDDLADEVAAAGGEVHRETLSVLDGAGEGGAPVKVMYLTDPDGTRIELMAGSPDLALFGPQPA
jgi:glyoxylase I family protein